MFVGKNVKVWILLEMTSLDFTENCLGKKSWWEYEKEAGTPTNPLIVASAKLEQIL